MASDSASERLKNASEHLKIASECFGALKKLKIQSQAITKKWLVPLYKRITNRAACS
jgi:hypothetical protein